MANKKFRVLYDAPLTLTLTIFTALLFILDSLILKGKLSQALFISYGTLSEKAFSPSNPLSYLRILLHVFGCAGWSTLLINSTFFLLIGTTLEDRYGSVIFGLMIFISTLVAGVIGIFCPLNMSGASPVIFMMIFLSAVSMITKKNIQISWILIFVFYTAYAMASALENNGPLIESRGLGKFLQSNIPTFIAIVSGIASSLFGFLSAPKEKSSRKDNYESYEEDYPTKKGRRKSNRNDDEVVGSIRF